MLIEHVKQGGRYAGTFVAKAVDNDVIVGWSKCHWLDYDKYMEMYNGSERQLKSMGIEIANARIDKTKSAPMAESLKIHLDAFVDRIRRQKRFKDKTIVLANLPDLECGYGTDMEAFEVNVEVDDGITEVGGTAI